MLSSDESMAHSELYFSRPLSRWSRRMISLRGLRAVLRECDLNPRGVTYLRLKRAWDEKGDLNPHGVTR